MHMGRSRRQVGGDAEEGQPEILDVPLAEMRDQARIDLEAAHQRDERQGVVVQGRPRHESFAHEGLRLVDTDLNGAGGCHESPDAGPSDQIDGESVFPQRLDGTEMGKAPRTAAGQDETDGLSARGTDEPLQV